MTGTSQIFAAFRSLHPSRVLALHSAHPTVVHIRPRVLLFDVRKSISYHPKLVSKSYLNSLPKDTVPVREAAVATTASVLGGLGVVALFCSAGVYV